MNRIFSTLGFSLWIALLSPMVQAANLKALDVAALPGDRVELKLSFDGPPPQPKGYTTESPARIALDLPGVASQLASKNLDLGSGNARTATVVEAKDRTRLIVSLTQLAPYDTRVEGNYLFVVVGQGAPARAPRPAVAAPRAATPAAPAKAFVAKPRAIRGVDFFSAVLRARAMSSSTCPTRPSPRISRSMTARSSSASPVRNCRKSCGCVST